MCLSVLFVEEDTTIKHTIKMYNLDFFDLKIVYSRERFRNIILMH